MTKAVKEQEMRTAGLNLLVIGNSAHHTKSLLFLIRELMRLDASVRATLVCYAAQQNTFAEMISDSAIQLTALDGKQGAEHGALHAINKERRPASKFLTATNLIKQYLVKVPNAAPIMRRPLKALIAAIKQTTPGLILRERAVIARFQEEKRMADQLFDRVAPNLVLAFGDRHPDIEVPILRVARERGIKVVIPYTTYSGKDVMVEVRKNDPDFQSTRPFSLYRRMKATHFREQLHEGLFYQPPSVLSACERFGVLSSYPWCLGNGLSDVICVDGEVTAQRYRNDRVDPEKIRIVGDVVYDKIADSFQRRREIKAALVQKYGFDAKRKLIALALPQLAEQGVMAWEPHWKEMRFLVEQVSKTQQNLLLSLHPRMNSKDYAFLEREYPCRIATERLSDFVSAPDLFIANYSSTVIWAVLCGVKTIVVDFYGLNYRFFDYLQSVSIVRERERLQPVLAASMTANEVDFSADWNALSREQVLDGRTMQRYLNLFDELTNGLPIPRRA